MDENKLDEILSILQDIKDDMGGMSAQKFAPKSDMGLDIGSDSPHDESGEDPAEEAAESPEEEKAEEESGDEEDISGLPRWKQRLHAMGKAKIGM